MRKRAPAGQREQEHHLMNTITGDLRADSFEGVKSVVECTQALPSKMLELSTIQIQLKLADELNATHWPPCLRVYRAAARFLYALVTFLSSDGWRRKLEIAVIFNLHPDPEPRAVRLVFWPLKLLVPQVDLEVSGLHATEGAELARLLERRITGPRHLANSVAELNATKNMVAALKSDSHTSKDLKLIDYAETSLERACKDLENGLGLWNPMQEAFARYSMASVHAIFTYLASKHQPDWKTQCRKALDTAYGIVLVAASEITLTNGANLQLLPKQLGIICRKVEWSPPETPK